MIIRIGLYIVAASLIGAHFLRVGNLIMVALCLATPLLFFVRRYWSLLFLQWLAYAAAAVWLETAWQLVIMRRFFGQPWHLTAVILITVAAVSVLAGSLLRTGTFRNRYCAR